MERNTDIIPIKRKRRWPVILAVILMMAICAGLGYRIGKVTTEEPPVFSTDLITGQEVRMENRTYTVQNVAALAADSVVEITTESITTGNFMQQYVSSGAGSGVIITEDGYILTNNHVIEGASYISVTLTDQTTYEAELVGRDADLDVALIKINAEGLSEAAIGDSSQLLVGEPVVAIGNPLGQLGGTVTDGIISALDREITMNGRSMNLLQTNAAINPGNSGGGLFDDEGRLVGLVVAKSAGEDVEGLGFAIPINDVAAILEDLKEYGYTRNKVSLGVTLLDINTEQMAMMYGVRYIGTYIYSVEEGSPAHTAGLQPGDCILSINETEITSGEDVSSLLKEIHVGETMQFNLLRNGQQMTLQVTAGEYIPEDPA